MEPQLFSRAYLIINFDCYKIPLFLVLYLNTNDTNYYKFVLYNLKYSILIPKTKRDLQINLFCYNHNK